MRWLFDFSLASDDAAGPRTLMDGLLRGWPEADPDDEVTVFGPASFRAATHAAGYRLVVPRCRIAPRRIIQQQVELPLRGLARRFDAVVVANVACSLVDLGPPVVGTLHDVRHLRRPEEFPLASRVFRGAVWAASARRMAAVASVSRFSLQEADDLGLPLPRRRAVTPNGTDHLPAGLAGRAKQDIVVCVAHRASKGLHELPRLWADVQGALGAASPLLVVTGLPPARHADVAARMAAAGVTRGFRLSGFLAARAFYTTIAEARAVLYLSTYEGYGLVPSEASSLGTHSFVYDLPPYRERAGRLSVTTAPVGDAVALARSVAGFLRDGGTASPVGPPSRWADVAAGFRELARQAAEEHDAGGGHAAGIPGRGSPGPRSHRKRRRPL